MFSLMFFCGASTHIPVFAIHCVPYATPLTQHISPLLILTLTSCGYCPVEAAPIPNPSIVPNVCLLCGMTICALLVPDVGSRGSGQAGALPCWDLDSALSCFSFPGSVLLAYPWTSSKAWWPLVYSQPLGTGVASWALALSLLLCGDAAFSPWFPCLGAASPSCLSLSTSSLEGSP